MILPDDAPVILPNAGEVSVAFGALKLGLFITLKASPRSCSECLSTHAERFAQRHVQVYAARRGEDVATGIPNVPMALAWKAAVLK